MKIECDKCAAKYSIADEKVRGKTFKIRCKKCSNVIIVRDKAAAAGADAEPDAGDEDQGAPGWHLAINGETLGPIAEDDVRDRYAAGEIDKDTAVWQEGFEDWIPLGDVPVFGDLPDQPAGGGYADDGGEDDPFASANQEDYAAGGGAAVAASAAVAAASHEPAPQSPRVSSLTGQRNENSVLFSLDSLQALATAPAKAAKPTAGTNQQVGTKGLATAAPGSEGSGLIDIRALGAMVGSDQQPVAAAAAPAVDDAALPSFGGSGLGGLAAAPLVAAPSPEPAAAAAAAAPPPPARSNAPIYALMVILILALGGLAAYILLKPEKEPQVIVKEVPGAAPSVADKAEKDDDEDKDKDKDKDEDEDKDKDKDKDEDEKDSADDGDEKDSAGGDTPAASTKSGSSSRSKKKKKSSSKPSGSSDPLADIGKSKPTPAAKKPSGKEDVSVDCILDPAACGRGKKKKSSSAPAASSDPNLPQKLGSSDIKAGVAPVKSAAKSCGGKHGASPGTRVKVRLSITGASGTVASATAEAPHKGTPLGNCVAAALKRAKFKKFKSSSMGAVYPISL